jgi:cellulose synthase/poly-beta-1,6-N-acetylglucosamine synthase-like glycosyltransferase
MWFAFVLMLILLIQSLFWFWLWYGISYRRQNLIHPDSVADLPSVSIIICAHNEADNLRRYLPAILEQQPGPLEVIVVNDHSTDETLAVLASLQERYAHLRIIESTQEPHSGKKGLLEQGIKAATGEVILLTDADCDPASSSWLKWMCSGFSDKNLLIGGCSPYIFEPGWINTLTRFENFVTAIQYLGFATNGLPYMAVGRNMAYVRKLIEQMGYFSAHTQYRSGDDDLTVQQALKQTKIAYCIHPDSFVYTKAPASLHAFFRQKIRHLSVGVAYPRKILIRLSAFILSWLFFYPAFLCLFFYGFPIVATQLLILRWIVAALAYNDYRQTLKQRFNFLQIIVLDFVFPWLMVLFSLFSLSRRNPQWK